MFRFFRSAYFQSKWFLATLLLLGLVYFEGRLSARLVADNRDSNTSAPTSSTQ